MSRRSPSFLSLVVLAALVFHSPPAVAAGKARPKGIALSAVVEGGLTGLAIEPASRRDSLKSQAESMIAFRDGELDDQKRDSVVKSCDFGADKQGNPFCPLIEKLNREANARRPSERRKHRRKIRKIVAEIKKARFDDLAKETEGNLAEAARHVRSNALLEKISEKLLIRTDCSSSALPIVLGLTAERRFPKDEARWLASTLYERALGCGQDASAAHAGYRLGLFSIWDKDCGKAEEVLSRVMSLASATDFRMRAAYWRLQCAKARNDDSTAARMREILTKEFPMSLHYLLARDGEDPIAAAVARDSEPEVSFRSDLEPELNGSIRAVETLQAMGEGQAALEILGPLLPKIRVAEPSFQLYVSVLLRRSRDASMGFQIAAGLFRDHPELITRATLQFLYPLGRLETVRAASVGLDPFLVLSLIRQESAFDEKAKSPAGAVGLMQLQFRTARNFERVSRRQLFDPKVNVRVGTKYLSRLIRRYHGDVELALASYNAGPQRIRQWMNRYPVDQKLLFLDILPIRETREYVSSIARNYYWYRALYSGMVSSGPAVALKGSLFDVFTEPGQKQAVIGRLPANHEGESFE